MNWPWNIPSKKTKDRILGTSISKCIFVALDLTDLNTAIKLALKLKNHVGGIKLGKEFFAANGPEGVRAISNLNIPVFLDLKFFDIPNTILGAIKALSSLNLTMISLHALGGRKMMSAAVTILDSFQGIRPMLLGITVLTSFEDTDLKEIGINFVPQDQVARLALLAEESGLDGVVCSPHEIETVRKFCRKDFKIVVPGIRPSWALHNDQRRTATPKAAIRLGADYLVIGRPITNAEDPCQAVERIKHELG